MAGVLWSLLGVLAGAFIAVQAPINAQLARGLGLPVAAAAFSFLSGAVVLGIVSLVLTRAQEIAIDWRARPSGCSPPAAFWVLPTSPAPSS